MTSQIRPSVDLEAVSQIIRQAAADEILPRFRNLQSGEVREKGPGDVVTDADVGAERAMTAAFKALLPGSEVVGEEGVSEDPDVISYLDKDGPVWVIDPVDGTANFTKGSDIFCSMVALVQGGETVAGWIYLPVTDEMAMAEKGAGATFAGTPLRGSDEMDPARMNTAIHVHYMPKQVGQKVQSRLGHFATNKELYCAGHTYLRVAKGDHEAAMFWKTNPWDHAMGVLILDEAGGATRFLDGAPYSPRVRDRVGIITTAREATWQPVSDLLWPEGMEPGRS